MADTPAKGDVRLISACDEHRVKNHVLTQLEFTGGEQISLLAAAVFSSRSGCRRAIEMPYVYLLVFRTAPEAGETGSAQRKRLRP